MNIYGFDGVIYGRNSEKDFFRFCLKRNKSLLKYAPKRVFANVKYLFNACSKKQCEEIRYEYLSSVKDIDKEVELFWNEHRKNINKWYPDWRLKDDVMITKAPEFLVAPIAKEMNFTLSGTKVDKNTGKIAGEFCIGAEKVKRYREIGKSRPVVRVFLRSLEDKAVADMADCAYIIKNDKALFWHVYFKLNKKPNRKQKRAYDEICKFETNCFYRKFLPYSSTSPENYPTYSERISDQLDCVNIVYFSDSHTDGTISYWALENVKRNVDFANNAPVNYDAVINAGDMITPFGKTPKEKAYKMAEKFFRLAKKSKVPFIFAKGNHDLNDWDNYPDRVFTDKDWSDLFYDFAERKYGIVRQIKKSGEKSTWHYFDIEDKKVRIVSVDIQDTDKTVLTEDGLCKLHGGKSFYISNEQMNWIKDVAFNFDDKPEKDWGIIITHHQYPKNSKFHQNAADVLLDICVALNEQGTYSYSYKHEENNFFDMEIEADFTRYANEEEKPHIICWLLGHDHERKNELKKGINIIWTINGSPSTSSSDPRMVRIKGASTQNSFDVVNIDTRHRKIRIFAYGPETDCYGHLNDRFLPDGLDY